MGIKVSREGARYSRRAHDGHSVYAHVLRITGDEALAIEVESWSELAAIGETYGYHHSSDNGAYHIMGNGTRAFAIRNEDNPLHTAELSTEQNYNQIDGIINNQPTVAQLEQDAKSGKPISLMDLLDATRREEKQSVMEQLKTKPTQDSKKEKTAPSKGAEMER